jgi:NADPH:quinone reductase-like Zn-dependent oxidoreductase
VALSVYVVDRHLQALKAAGVYEGNRVLILGGSGGVGTCLVQLAKRAGASFVAATSTEAKLVTQLGADRVVDYTSENWWALDEFSERPIDVVIDCAEGSAGWAAAKRKTPSGKRVLSSTGRWLAVVLNGWHIKVTQPWHMASVMAPPLGRQLSNTLWPFGPRYKMFLGGVDKATLTEVVALVASGDLKIVVDKRGPFAFDEAGVRAAFALLESKHAHGKVLVQIAA